MDLLKKLGQIGAVYKDYHFVYKSGKHGPHYINPDDLLPYLPQIPDLGRTLASKFRHQVDVVLGPDFGGNYLALLTAVALGEEGDAVMWVATRKLSEEEGGGFIIEPDRGFERFLSGRRVLIVEDLLTTGSSVVQVRDVVAHHKANAVGISAVVNRGGVTAKVLKDHQAEVRRLERTKTLGIPGRRGSRSAAIPCFIRCCGFSYAYTDRNLLMLQY
jgi:orotate phosphoribosyltransferase